MGGRFAHAMSELLESSVGGIRGEKAAGTKGGGMISKAIWLCLVMVDFPLNGRPANEELI